MVKHLKCFFQIAESFDMPFYEVSCKQDINIEEAFITLARLIRDQRNQQVKYNRSSILCY